MKKEKVEKTNAMRLLDKGKYPYEVHSYAWKEDELDAVSVGEKIEKPLGQVYKTLVLKGDKTGVIVVLLDSQGKLNLKKVASVSGNKKVEMLPLKDLEKTTGYIRGGCSPLGMKKHFPTFIAKEAQNWQTLIFSAGRRGAQIELSLAHLIELTNATLVDVTDE